MLEAAYFVLFIINPLMTLSLATLLIIKGFKMSDVQAAVDAVTAQLGRAKDEILGEIAKLEAAVGSGEQPDLSGLKAAAQALDDVVPDSVEVEAEVVEGETPALEG